MGQIVECRRHSNAEKLYVSQVRMGLSGDTGLEHGDRILQICSGLVNFIPIDKMTGRNVVVLENLKASKMRGEVSEAMLLAAEKMKEGTPEETEVELVTPPDGTELGERLQFENYESSEAPPRLKSKAWLDIQLRLATNSRGEVIFNDGTDAQSRLISTRGYEAATSIANAKVR